MHEDKSCSVLLIRSMNSAAVLERHLEAKVH